jgi:predicted RNase H-like nuclease (RuvC/YqgF family)
MPMKTLVRITALLSLGFLATLATPAQDPSSQQSVDPLAEAARKARAEQKTEPKPKKVFTNDDIPNPPAAKPSDANASTLAPVSADDKVDSEENDPKSEKYWRKQFAKTRAKLAQAEQEADVLQRELNKNEVQYYPDPQKALMQQYSRKDINEGQAKLDAKKKEVESLKQQLSDMEDALRKSGGDPGWAR